MAPGASRLALLAAAAAASPTAAPTSALCGVTVGNRTNLDTGGLKAAWEALGYDRTLRPLEATTGGPNAPPELVQVGALLLGFSLDEANTNWSPRYFQRTRWVDPRLAYDVPAGCDVAYVYLGAYEWRTYLWRPIPYVKNLARWVDGHQLAGGIWVYPDGTVFESRLVNDELTCRLDVTNCVETKSSTRLQCEHTRQFRRKLFGRASSTRREQSIRPKISRIDFELESSKVWDHPAR